MRQIPVKAVRAFRQIMLGLLLLSMLFSILPWADIASSISYGAELSKAEVLRIAQTIEDEQARAKIIDAANEGAVVRFSYAVDGRVASYKIIREGISKRHEDMTTQEKRQALDLMIRKGTVPNRIFLDDMYYSLNITLWMERGIIVYGETKAVNQKNSVTSGSNYKNGMYRFWGYDMNGGLFGNDDFPRDSDSGTPPEKKAWLTTTEIYENSTARRYIGEHGVNANSRYSDGDKKKTARRWLSEHPEWKKAGLTEDYILQHFYFNSVLSDSGLTTGQFTGVHRSRQSGTLYYQSFSVTGTIPVFEVSEGTVEEKILIAPTEPPTPEGPEQPQPPELPEIPEEPEIPPEEITDVEVQAQLSLPKTTYEGHPTIATDSSAFTVNGEYRSATRVYAEGLASNRFRIVDGGGTIRKSGAVPTKAEAVFPRAGTYSVTLTVSPKGASSASDTKSIQVLKTPAIAHSLSGAQKENRRQVLTMWIASRPDRPLKKVWAEIRDVKSGETVKLIHHVGAESGTANALQNSALIKTRPIEGLESDGYFTNCQLEFLTKSTARREFSYTIYAEDSAGNSDRVEQSFIVEPDLAPEAAIAMENTFLRDQGKNQAKITAKDISQTDGDQLRRSWSCASFAKAQGTSSDATQNAEGPLNFTDIKGLSGYEDMSFGTGQEVGFFKEGVGSFRMRLSVTDVWTEETLAEYITEADYKSASVECDVEVINVAPQVSLKPVETKIAELLFLSKSREADEAVRAQLSQVTAALLELGIDGRITTEQMLPATDETSDSRRPWEKTIEVNTPFGYQGSWTKLYEEDNFIADDQRLYKIDATWLGSDLNSYPQSPYTITAWDGESGNVDWTYTFSENVLSVPDRGPHFVQDDTQDYLYFVADNKTLLLKKETGAYLTTLPFAVGSQCFVGNNKIYTVKSDGIYAIHTGTGSLSKLYSGTIGQGARRFGGSLSFVLRSGQMLYRARMDMNTQEVTLQRLNFTAKATAAYDAEVFATDGSLLIRETDGSAIRFTLFDKGGSAIGAAMQNGERLSAYAVRDGSGNVRYVAFAANKKGSKKYYSYITCCDLLTGGEATVSLDDKNGYPTEARIIAAEQDGDIVYVSSGGYITWMAGSGWGNGPSHGYPQRTKTIRFSMKTQSGQEVSNSKLQMDDKKEYGRSSDVYAVIQSGQNGEYQSPPSGNITTLYRRYQTENQVENRYQAKYLSRDGSAVLQKTFIITEEQLAKKSLAEIVKEEMDREKIDTSVYVKLKRAANTSTGSILSRSAVLQPDTTYYYEYNLFTPNGSIDEAKDIFSVQAQLPQTTQTHRTDQQYRIVRTMKESFDNNSASGPYFKGLLVEHIASDRYAASATGRKKKVDEASAPLSFTVEEGQLAVLSFAYDIQRYYRSSYFANDILIDGQSWKVPIEQAQQKSGYYTHPFLLSPGEHHIELVAKAYGEENSVTAIDDLTVEYVVSEKCGSTNSCTSAQIELINTEESFKEQIGEGWAKISGSFRTPASVIAYQGVEGAVVSQSADEFSLVSDASSTGNSSAAQDEIFQLLQISERDRALQLQIPKGMTPVYGSIHAVSSPIRRNSHYYGVNWTVNGMAFTAQHENFWSYHDEGRLGSRGLPQEYDFILPCSSIAPEKWTEPIVEMIPGGSRASGYSKGEISKATMAFVVQPDEMTDQGRFFLQTQGDAAGVYTANQRFEGQSQMGFVLPGADYAGIAGLKVYTVRDGVRLYAAEEDMTKQQELNRWKAQGISAEIHTDGAPIAQGESMVYAKGQLVHSQVHYMDYENDPSKKAYWRYTHQPFNDGPHPEAAKVVNENGAVIGGNGKILSAPIQRFYIDGKYTIEHWQTDSTGNAVYDKDSNIASMIIYVGGGSSAPWITSIATQPSPAKEGEDFTVKVGVADREGDPLQLEVEIYREGQSIHKENFSDIRPNGQGVYPLSVTKPVKRAPAGKYEIICTVKDETGTGIGNRQFTIKPEGRIEGSVAHTTAWDSNRRSYNLKLFKNEASRYNQPTTLSEYKKHSTPRPRSSNVFWAGEEFVLSAAVAGKPVSVTAEAGGYRTTMTSTGIKNSNNETIYKGSLWDKAMRGRWGKVPEELTFTFSARYADHSIKQHKATIILDSNTEYWLLHRYF